MRLKTKIYTFIFNYTDSSKSVKQTKTCVLKYIIKTYPNTVVFYNCTVTSKILYLKRLQINADILKLVDIVVVLDVSPGIPNEPARVMAVRVTQVFLED